MSELRQAERRRAVSSTEAAFAGFTLVRQRPALFISLIVLTLILGLAASVLQVVVAGPAFTHLMELQLAAANGGTRPDPAEVMQTMGPIWEMDLLLFPLLILFYAVSNAAAYRAFMRPTQGRFGYLRFGADELRQIGVFILFGLTMLGVGIVCEIVAVIAGIAAASALGASGQGAGASPSASVLIVAALVVVLVLVPQVLIGVRLSLAGPMTFAQKRVRLTGSWAVTKGRFWTMFGAYLLAGIVIVIVAILLLVVSCGVAFALGGVPGVRGLFMADSRSLATFFTPARIVLMLLNAPVGALWFVVQAAVPASLHQQIVGPADAPADGVDRSHAFGARLPSAPPPPPDTEYPITPPRAPPPPSTPPPGPPSGPPTDDPPLSDLL